MDSQSVLVRRLTNDDLNDIVSLLKEFYPEWSMDNCREWWINKYNKNPYGEPMNYGAYIDGILAGIECCMPIEYVNGDKNVMMLISCDSKVRVAYRGRGIWSKVVRFCVKDVFESSEFPLILGFPNYRNSYPGYQKMEWQTIDQMHNYLMVNSADKFSKAFGGRKPIKRLVGRMLVLQRAIVSMTNTSSYKVDPCNNSELLWDDANGRIHLAHGDAMLDWKRLYKEIKTVKIKYRGKQVASCIYSFGEFENELICKIEKFVSIGENQRIKKRAFSALLKYLKMNVPEAAFVRIWTMEDTEVEQLCKESLMIKAKHPNPFIIKQRGGEYDNSKWNLTFLDLD